MQASGEKVRIDRLIVERGLASSRQKALSLLMAGHVIVDGRLIEKPGVRVVKSSEIDIRIPRFGFVGRGGEKLRAAIEHFGVDVQGKVCIDIGASTGGFTECLLKRGARLVYAVDVGYGQLAYKLRDRPDVICMERTNARYLESDQIGHVPELATIDVSFISLRLILPKAFELLSDSGEVIALIKPQFEVGKGKVGKGGIVKDPCLHRSVLKDVVNFSNEIGFHVNGIVPSCLRGAKGNYEYLMSARKQAGESRLDFSKEIEIAISSVLSNEVT
ncbi:TlyA family RNA methyltransferase [bacterium]|nr:TlyA family RNA methyltransferase [bacterium]